MTRHSVVRKFIIGLLFAGLIPFVGSEFAPAQADAGKQESEKRPEKQQFTLLDRFQTGINFESPLLPDHPFAYLYHSGMTCSGLAAGDIDGDGRPDLFLANGPGPNALYLQSGKGIHFEDVTKTAGADLAGGDDWASGVALADVDNDGDLDLYICNYESPNRLFINSGPSANARVHFKEVATPAGIDIVDASHAAAFGDYDNDGDLDLFLLTNRVEDPNGALSKLPVQFLKPGVPSLLPGFSRYYDLWIVDADNWGVEATGRPDYLFRNDGVDTEGQVKFTDVTQQSGISGRGDGLSCTWWDADLDGDCDLYVCNDFISPDRFYRNNGDGTFTNQIAESMPHTTWFSMGSNFGDIDNDGDFDLLVADMSATNHYKSKVTMGAMGGTALRRANESSPPQYMRNALFLNEGLGRFREAAFLAGIASSDWTWAIKMNDFDADGQLDVFLTNGVPREMNHSDIKITQEMLAGKHMWEFFKDGKMRKEQNLAYRNRGELQFEDVSADWGLDHEGASYGTVAADFDLDGDLDLAMMNLEENVFIYENNGSSHSQFTIKLKGTKSNRNGVGATVRVVAGDQTWIRQLMPGTGYHSYDEPVLHFGIGDQTTIQQIQIRWPSGLVQDLTNVELRPRIEIVEPVQVILAEQPRTRQRSLFRENFGLEDLWHQENRFDDFALQPLLPHRLSAEGPCMAWGDVNQDGLLDVFLGGSAGSAGELRLGKGDGKFEIAYIPDFFQTIAGEDSVAKFGDFDADGDLDLLVGRGSYEFNDGVPEQINLLYINDGKGRFKRAEADAIPDTATNTGAIAICDYDRDGDLDAFVGTRVRHGEYPLSNPSQIWKNENGRFTVDSTAANIIADAGMVTDAIWTDVNGDSWQDLVVTREWATVAVYLNDAGTLSHSPATGELANRTGWWSAISAGDIDGDGDIDLVVSNVGLNTKYKTSLAKPMTVYYGDFDESGKSHIVEVKQEGNICYPERGRSCSSNAMPFIANKFETYHEFGLATLNDIYGDEKLSNALKFEANTFDHAVFTNNGQGEFSYQPLPRISQIAPSRALALADVDGDRDLDIVMGQNFFGPQSETGHYDGGLGQILTNNGHGKFLPLAPQDSGLVVREAATEVFVGDVNNDQRTDIVIATHNGPIRIFLGSQNE